ncbi:MAG: Na/Pi cotransporter family protein [Planctomycetota bacterium]
MLILLQIAGGVALILFGIRFLRKGLDRLFGDRLPGLLQRLARNRWRAAGAGLLTSLAAPSSTAMSLLAVQSVRAGDLPTRRVVPMLLGADVGITVMVVLISLRLESLAPVLALLGVAMFQFMPQRRVRGVGQVALALAFILMGVETIATSARLLPAGGDLTELISIGVRHPWLLTVLAAGLAVLLQSSTAAIALAIGLGSAEAVSGGDGGARSALQLALPIVFGANVGVAVTLLAAGWSDRASRRLGLANLIAKASTATLGLLAMPGLIALLATTSLTLDARIAVTHSGFNLVMAALFLPWTDTLYALVSRVFPDRPELAPDPARPRFILSDHVAGASVALGQSRQEIVRLSSMVRTMLDDAWIALMHRDETAARKVQARDHDIDRLHHHIKRYLANLSPDDDTGFSTSDVMQQLAYLNQLETIGDTVDRGLADLAIRRTKTSKWFTDEGWEELDGFYKHVAENLLIAETAFNGQDATLARRLIEHKRLMNERNRQLRLQHFQRLRAGVQLSHESSALHLDLLTHLKAINSCVAHVAYAILDGQPDRNEQAPAEQRTHADADDYESDAWTAPAT